ncbi:MAG: SusC/RagA family TonB-linked outer membrane protein [Hymenobacter sp.]|nr:MAG: SusC/RagA family TonB-linked outer membrane protein [Hymenobacter sp.]
MKRSILLSLLLMLTLFNAVLAQTRAISGRVTDQKTGEGLPGVTVLLKGTTNGASTNSDGAFSLTVPTAGGTIVISSVGYMSQERTIGSSASYEIGLATDVKQLSEVVVTSFGRQQEKNAIGFSVSEVKSQELTQARSTNIVNSLTAKVAGVRIQAANGMVGASSNIFIRGFTTFTSSNQPLFVVDGIPIDNGGGGNALQNGVSNSNRAIDINQDDVESVSVLKGPAAAVLYGSRAASGAIIITMKKGTRYGTKKQSISVTSNYNIVKVGRLPDYQNTYGQGNLGVFNAISNASWGPAVTGQTVTNFQGQPEQLSINPNNVKDLFQTGSNFQNNVALSGATDRMRYYAAYGNLRETGILPNNELTRNTLTFNGSAQLTDKLRTGTSVIYTNNQSQRTPQGNVLANPFFRTWFLPRSYDINKYPFEQPDGSQQGAAVVGTFTPNNTWYSNDDNPLWTIKNNTYKDQINRLVGNVSLGYDFAPWVSVDYKLGVDTYNQIAQSVNGRGSRGVSIGGGTLGGASTSGGAALIGNLQDESYTRTEISSYLTANFKHDFSENFNARLLLGNEINQRQTTDIGVLGSDLQVRYFDNITNALSFQPFGERSKRRLVGFFGEAAFGYKNFATLTLSGRNDYSSTFGPGKRNYFYPGASASVLLSEMFPSFKQSTTVNLVKLRGAIAKVGREAPVYVADTYFSSTNVPADGFGPTISYPFRGQLGQSLGDAGGNATLGPEFTTSYEGGLDLSFFKSRVNVEATYYVQKSTDLIFAVPVAGASGFTSAYQNAGRTEAKGFEFLLNTVPVKTNTFTYSNSINFSVVRNKVLELAPGVSQITLGGFVTPSTRLIAGQPYGVIFGSVFQRERLDADGRPQGRLLLTSGGRAQLATNNQIVGNPNPKWTGGFTNTFTYKGFTLNTLLDIRYGGDIFSRNVSDLRRTGAAAETGDRTRTYVIDGVIANADGTFRTNNVQITAENYFDDLYGSGKAEFVIFDGSWLRLREVALNYTLPKTLTDKTFLGAVEFGLNARNVFLYAPNIPHIDPEVNAQGQSNSQGLEFNGLPQSKTYGGSIRLTF